MAEDEDAGPAASARARPLCPPPTAAPSGIARSLPRFLRSAAVRVLMPVRSRPPARWRSLWVPPSTQEEDSGMMDVGGGLGEQGGSTANLQRLDG